MYRATLEAKAKQRYREKLSCVGLPIHAWWPLFVVEKEGTLDTVTTYRDCDTEYLCLLDFPLTFTGGVNENSFPF